MKYCSHCGSEVNENAVICTKCGCQIENIKPKKNKSTNKGEVDYIKIISIIIIVSSVLTLLSNILQIYKIYTIATFLALFGNIAVGILLYLYTKNK